MCVGLKYVGIHLYAVVYQSRFVGDAQAGAEDAAHMFVHLAFGHEALLHCLTQGGQAAAALEVHLAAEGIAVGGSRGGVGTVARDDGVGLVGVVQGPAVGDEDAVVLPFIAQDIEQTAVCAARLFVEPVISAHHLLHVAVFDDILEGGQVGGAQVALRHHAVELVADAFGAAVHGQVLEAGGGRECVAGSPKLGVPMLQPVDACQAHRGGKEGVLAVGLHAASPAWVAEDVDVGREEGKARIVAIVAGVLRLAVFVTSLGGYV